MGVTELSIKRPATIIIIVILLLGLGIIGYNSMGVDMLPSMNIPVITVSVSYTGAGSDEINKEIVMPIENAVSGISGIDTLSSTARQGSGTTVITFTQNTNINSALMDVEKAVDRAQRQLPTAADKPIIQKIDPNASAVLMLTVSGATSYDEIYNVAYNVQQGLQNLPNIGQVSLLGANAKQLQVKLDKSAVEYYGINLKTLMALIGSENVNTPAGDIVQGQSDLTVDMVGEFQNIDDVKNIMVPTSNSGSVRLGDIAQVNFDYPTNDTSIKLNGKNAIAISVQKQSDANVVETVDGVKNELVNIRKTLPKGVDLGIAYDTTTSIKASVNNIKENIIEGIITTALVLFLFLRNWRSSLIVLIAIPTSLISTFFAMYVCHFTLNMMSLLALSLCIGILVDDSIVVLENIIRHREMGKSPAQAALDGRQEIGMAAVAITLCDVVVFTPVAFVSGTSGALFREFGLTVAFAALFSLFISFTVTPMLSSRILRDEINPFDSEGNSKLKKYLLKVLERSRLFQKAKELHPFEKATELYKTSLLWSLKHRLKIIAVFVIGVVASIALLPLGAIKTEFIPQTDNNQLSVNLLLNPGSSLEQTESKAIIVEKYLHTLPEVTSVFSRIGGSDKSTANFVVGLVDKSQRQKTQAQVGDEIRGWSKRLTGASVFVSQASMGAGGFGFGGGGRGGGGGIQINLEGSDNTVLKTISYKIENLVKSIPGVVDVNNSVRQNENEIRVNVNRLACNQYGVSPSDVASILRTSIAGSTVGEYTDSDGTSHDIVVSFEDNQIKTPADIGSIKIMNAAGQQIALNQVASIVMADSQKTISRQDRLEVINITANLQQNVALGTANAEIQSKLSTISLPYGYSIKFGGNQKSMSDSFGSLGEAMAGSIVLVYMILVILYESFLTPLIRMLSLPCAIIGAFIMLAITRNTLNLTTMIGLIMLDGLASKNGTLLIDYTNTLMKRGKSLREALIESGTTRLRPIIMTSLTMIVGMLPAVFTFGQGSEMKVGMALVIIGGMIASTIFTPIILPVVYTVLDDMKHRPRKRREILKHTEA
ncbi:cation/multidrug efflux pump [Desulfosporosinus acidiphilus SJ4]|uniref:Cation/multidrug efflux pump n=1 Tax=Desulfosporosinus acidiphilus (strain DSM 22704 / JCM 16185 / SJ4) TaxID=646529 RepID=I4DC02_DESAJ|nr:efflux RND transporter permease subunit [Desulfosporosinus acidiphilus]AFM43326.1 cation/multidrug efflux pump [Desulfosporosinus acidiphilus SJ4]